MRQLLRLGIVAGGVLFGAAHCGQTSHDAHGGTGGATTDGASTTDGVPPPDTTYCFVAGTSIATARGAVAIETLRAGDSVLGYDVLRRQVVTERVIQIRSRAWTPTVTLGLSDGRELRTTSEHPFFAGDSELYLPAALLDSGTPLLSLATDNRHVTTSAVTTLALSSAPPATVYNLSVSGTENYFAQGVLVHNKSPNECPFNPSLCRPEGGVSAEPWCVPPVADWQVCSGGVASVDGLVFDLAPAAGEAPPLPAVGGAPAEVSDGEAGAMADVAGMAGAAGTGGTPAYPSARLGTRLCNEATARHTDQISLEVQALDTLVSGQLRLEFAYDLCGAEQGAVAASYLDLKPGERTTLCLSGGRDGDHLRLSFESRTLAASSFAITRIAQGCD